MADLFAHEKDAVVSLHFLDHCLAKRVSESNRSCHGEIPQWGCETVPLAALAAKRAVRILHTSAFDIRTPSEETTRFAAARSAGETDA
jgi:hypothetical protein